jgi:hypothetical protein
VAGDSGASPATARVWNSCAFGPAECAFLDEGDAASGLMRAFSRAMQGIRITSDIAERLEWHNHGASGYTVDHRPWSVVVSIEFRNERDD